MTYFNPKIYNKENLKEKDREELEYWHKVFLNVIDGTKFDLALGYSDTLDKIKQEIIENYTEHLKEILGYAMQETVVGIIESYDEDVEEVEDYETFLHDGSEDE